MALFIAPIIRPFRRNNSLRTTLLLSPTYITPSDTRTEVVTLLTVGPMTVCHKVCARLSSIRRLVPSSLRTSIRICDSFFDVSSGILLSFLLGGGFCFRGFARLYVENLISFPHFA